MLVGIAAAMRSQSKGSQSLRGVQTSAAGRAQAGAGHRGKLALVTGASWCWSQGQAGAGHRGKLVLVTGASWCWSQGQAGAGHRGVTPCNPRRLQPQHQWQRVPKNAQKYQCTTCRRHRRRSALCDRKPPQQCLGHPVLCTLALARHQRPFNMRACAVPVSTATCARRHTHTRAHTCAHAHTPVRAARGGCACARALAAPPSKQLPRATQGCGHARLVLLITSTLFGPLGGPLQGGALLQGQVLVADQPARVLDTYVCVQYHTCAVSRVCMCICAGHHRSACGRV